MGAETRPGGASRPGAYRLAAAVVEAVLVGGLAWAACMWLLAPVHGTSPWNADDFVDYCNGVAHLRGDADVSWPVKRSRLPALLPLTLASRHGVTAGLAVGASVGTVVGMGAVYAWTRVLAGRLAGALAVLAALALVPVSQTPRLLSFYPQVNAFLLVGAVMVAWGVRRGGVPGGVALGAGASLALCADARGLAWALPWVAGGALVGAVRLARDGRGAARGAASTVVAVSVTLLIGWLLGRACFPADAASFESQLDPRPIFHAMGSTDPTHQPPFDEGGRFVWGRTSPHRLGDTVGFVLRTLALRPPPGFPPAIARLHADAILGPLDLAWASATLVALLALVRRPALLAALLVSVGPYLVAWRGQHSVAQVYARFLQQLLPALAVLVGVGLGMAVDAACDRLGDARRTFARAAVALGGACVVLGVVPTPLSPWAAWRRPWPYVGQLDEVDPRREAPVGAAADVLACRGSIARDVAAGAWFPHRRR